ncbi:MAG: AmmeMemoRadiSam system protein B [Treponema sp.]|nr:AmmeMemoRadiSam system protein B [Treponema sp.]
MLCDASSSALHCLICGSCSSVQDFASGRSRVQSFRFHLASDRRSADTLAFGFGPLVRRFYQARSGLSPPSYSPCRAHHHLTEHSLEVLLPLVKCCFPSAEIVPVLMGGSRQSLISVLARTLNLVLETRMKRKKPSITQGPSNRSSGNPAFITYQTAP